PEGTRIASVNGVVVTPPATILTVIVCLPQGLPSEALTAAQLDRHFGVSGTLHHRFWARAGLKPWQRGRLVGLRKGRPISCAGGRSHLLDLDGMRKAAAVGAALRHQLWQQVVPATPTAHPWQIFLARHLAEPARYPRQRVVEDFWNQPRVNAMRMHNAIGFGA